MKISTIPTSLMLVGFLFICIFLTPALAEQQLHGPEQLNKFKYHPPQKSTDLGVLKVGADTIYFPWHRQNLRVRPAISCSISTSTPQKEEILMNRSNSRANVRGLSAINSLKQRDLHYKDSQNGEQSYQGLANAQDISVSGKGNDTWQEDDIGGRELDNSDPQRAGNYLSVDVKDISVSAINTVQGGSAVATSNIIIEPVQIIVCPSEIDVKLK